jgi:acetyltransferase-like isoleucine patch superfamily enzyme
MSDRVYLRKNGKWEARYVKGKSASGKTLYGSAFGDTREEAMAKREIYLGHDPNDPFSGARLNIVILGAGSFGHEVKEELEKLHIFNEIVFLDDNIKGEEIKGRCCDVELFRFRYPCAFVAIGNNEARKKYAKKLIDCGFYVPTIISRDAIVSSKAKIGVGCMIFAQANVGAASVGNFCLVQANGLVNAEASLGDFSRIDSGAIVLKGERAPEDTWLKPGKILGDV